MNVAMTTQTTMPASQAGQPAATATGDGPRGVMPVGRLTTTQHRDAAFKTR